MALTMGEKIRILIKRKKITISELAKLIGTTNQNLFKKLTRDNFQKKSSSKLLKLFDVCKFEGFFVFEDGYKI